MLPPQDQLDILNSDVKLSEYTHREAGPGGLVLAVHGDLMPDGQPCRVMYPADTNLNLEILTSWCNHVRREWNERTKRKEAEEASRAAALQRVDNQQGSAPRESSRGGGQNQTSGAEREASVEEVIEAQVARLERAVAHYRQIRDATADAHRSAEARLRDVTQEWSHARSVLGYLRGLTGASQGSVADSEQPSGREAAEGRESRSGVVGDEVPTDQ